jgi:membrane-associated phospholipid phosphatase
MSQYNIMQLIDNIGFLGPLIQMVINIAYIWNRNKYLITYLAFFLLNSQLNNGLKYLIKEPRPPNQIYLNEYDISEKTLAQHKYGMPSGHAQSTGYSVAFLYLVTKSPPLLMVSMFIGAITVYQRYKYHRHTIEQLVAGLVTGVSMALISHTLVTKYYIQL